MCGVRSKLHRRRSQDGPAGPNVARRRPGIPHRPGSTAKAEARYDNRLVGSVVTDLGKAMAELGLEAELLDPQPGVVYALSR